MGKVSHEFIVIFASAWMNADGWGFGYDWDGERFKTLAKASKHGWRTRGSDDFNIGHVIGNRLVWFGWMDEQHDEDNDTMAEIAEAIGLEFAASEASREPSDA